MSYLDQLHRDIHRIVEGYRKWNKHAEINWSLFTNVFEKYINPICIWDCDDFPDDFVNNFAFRIQTIIDRYHIDLHITIHYKCAMCGSKYWGYGLAYEVVPFLPDEFLKELFLFFIQAKCRDMPEYQSKRNRTERLLRRIDLIQDLNLECEHNESTLRIVMYGHKIFKVHHISLVQNYNDEKYSSL